MPTELLCVRWAIPMTRLSLKNSPVELQWPYTARELDIPFRKADAWCLYVYSGHIGTNTIRLLQHHPKTISTKIYVMAIYSIAQMRNNINSLWNIDFDIYRLFIVQKGRVKL